MHPRYRGPRRLGIGGLLLAVLGGAAAVAAFVVAQAQGVVNSTAMDVLGGFVGLDTGGDTKDPSVLLIATFVAGLVVGALGLCLVTIAVVWALVRARARERARGAWDRAQPALAEAGTRGRQAADVGRRRLGEAVARRRDAAAPPVPAATQPARGLTQGDPLTTRTSEPD